MIFCSNSHWYLFFLFLASPIINPCTFKLSFFSLSSSSWYKCSYTMLLNMKLISVFRRAISYIRLVICLDILFISSLCSSVLFYCSFCDCLSIFFLKLVGVSMSSILWMPFVTCFIVTIIYCVYICWMIKMCMLSLFLHIYNIQSWSNHICLWDFLSFYNISEFYN